VKKSAWLAFGEVVGLLLLVAIASYLAGKYVESKQPRQPKTEPKAYFGPEAVNQQSTQAPQQVYVNPQPTYREPSTLMGRCPACQGRGYFNDPTICSECGGAGEVIGVRVVAYIGGIPVYQRDSAPTTCSKCGGRGFHPPTYGRCETCGGRTTGDWIEYWRRWARQYWLTYYGGQYKEVIMK
jgi:uncharacterized OB-fold protein